MYSLLKGTTLKHLLLAELPAAGIALLITETFCKFHSFTLELLVFMAIWFIGSSLFSKLLSTSGSKR